MVRATVETVTVAVAVPLAASATDVGEIEQFDALGAPPHEREIVLVKPEMDEIFRLNVVVFPATTATLAGSGVIVKSGTMPVPLRNTTCGLPGTLSVMVSAPRLAPELVAV